MLDHGLASLTQARADGRALAAFSTSNLEITMAVCRAADSTGQSVILQAGSSTFKHAGRDSLVSIALQGARQARVPVGVHLDHSRDIEEIRYCIEAGYTSVMIDGSSLPFEQNIALTREVVELAAPRGVWVEGELGAIPGDEDRSIDAVASELTDPALADEFAEKTGVAALAVAVGNVHGITPTPRPLDLDRLAQIQARVPVPLVLHGASGLPSHELLAAITTGVAKVNINTELRQAFLASVTSASAEAVEAADLARVLGDAVLAVQRLAESKILVLAGIPSDRGSYGNRIHPTE
jgi:ketose-bisphosphate aldolase